MPFPRFQPFSENPYNKVIPTRIHNVVDKWCDK